MGATVAGILRHRVQLLLGGCMLPLWVIVSVKATWRRYLSILCKASHVVAAWLAVFANNGCCSCLVEAQCQQ